MNKRNSIQWAVSAAIVVAAAVAPNASATCVPFPCATSEDCWVQWQGQFNLVVMDREAGTVKMVPNIKLTGSSETFALVVPTPALPTLDEADSEVWDETFLMTASIRSARSDVDDSFGCSSSDAVSDVGAGGGFGGDAGSTDDGVVIHGEETVGAFHATILSSDSTDALINWLNENNFHIDEDDADRFDPLVEDGWFFTAMKLDTTVVSLGFGNWNVDVDPVSFEWSGTGFELPLPVLTINGSSMQMVMFVVDDHRVDFDGFRTMYANKISAGELEVIGYTYPSVAEYLRSGAFFTRLDRTFTSASQMKQSLSMKQASTDGEFRRVSGGSGWIALGAVMIWIPAVAFSVNARVRKRR